MNKEFISNEKKYKDYNNDSSKVWLNYDLNFYNYTDNWLGSKHGSFYRKRRGRWRTYKYAFFV